MFKKETKVKNEFNGDTITTEKWSVDFDWDKLAELVNGLAERFRDLGEKSRQFTINVTHPDTSDSELQRIMEALKGSANRRRV